MVNREKSKWIFLLIILFGYFRFSWTEKQACFTKQWCDECITAHSDCAWCKDKGFSGNRCDLKAELEKLACTEIEAPNNTETLLQNSGLQDGDETKDPIQIKPQKVKLQVRPGRVQTVNMTYRIAENLPIDMYFVLDFTTTMKDRLQSLADLTDTLISSLQQEFTTNIHIGFGSFLDKPVQPFAITTPEQLENPCLSQRTTCGRSYGFIHRQKLNSNTEEFIQAIKNANTSSNFDPMEGGLDALMQAAVCPDIIGWRNQSRRVLVYISDEGFHFAGDGKLAGIDKPHDGQCHMNKHADEGITLADHEFMYSESKNLDYPSYSMLSKALDENRINTFFVVDQGDKLMYEGLSGVIKQASTAIMDESGAHNIVKHIKDYYTSLSKKVEIYADDIPSELDVKIVSDCSQNRVKSTWDLKVENAKCSSLVIGKQVLFEVNINLLQCPKDGVNTTKFKILPAGLQESLEIELSYTCDCKCETSEALNREECSNGSGTYDCGVCKCNPGRSGVSCQCDKNSNTNVNEDDCKRDNATNIICENHGSCKCGQCQCLPNFEGKYCECESSKCKMQGSNVKCSGKEHGDCVCEKCVCKGGYYGDFCQCRPETFCLAENGLKCNGKGKCVCGKCECDPDYEGDTCELCPKCDRCRKCGHRECVECLDNKGIKGENITDVECLKVCSGLHIIRVDRFSKEKEPCGFIDANQCELMYMVECDEENNVNLLIAKGKLCSEPPDPLLIAMPILGGILGVGLLLLIIWKILTTFYDKIEYARFEHEIQNAKWTKEDNPIYKTPVTTNQNPVYRGTVD